MPPASNPIVMTLRPRFWRQPPSHDVVIGLVRKYDADGTGHLNYEVRCAALAPAGLH